MSRLYKLMENVTPCRICKDVPSLYERCDDGTVRIACSCGKKGGEDDTITAAMLVWNREQDGELVQTVAVDMNGTIKEVIGRLNDLEVAIRKDPRVYGEIEIINCNTINVQVCCKMLTEEELQRNKQMARESEELSKEFGKVIKKMWNVNPYGPPRTNRKPRA